MSAPKEWKSVMEKKQFVTRNECRQLGLNVSNTQFLRYENAKLLTPLKVAQFRSAIVRYRIDEVLKMLTHRDNA